MLFSVPDSAAAHKESVGGNSVTRFAPAKINLALHVTGRREDGYHLLDMLVAFGDVGDFIHISISENDHFHVSGPFSKAVPLDGRNLMLKARDRLKDTVNRELPPVSIHLEKNLPIASGIGGGSSDAAATLLALNDLWGLNLSFNEVAALGLSLGADLPMCLHGANFGTPLIARGVGEKLHTISGMPTLPLVLINDGTALSTPQVFAAINKRDNPPLPAPKIDSFDCLRSYLPTTRNDLLQPALSLAPNIAQKLELLRSYDAIFAQMSGSGATCFAVFSDQKSAVQAAREIRSAHPDWFITATQTGASIS